MVVPADGGGGQEGVHGAAAKPFEIERDELVAEAFEGGADLVLDSEGKDLFHLCSGNFNAGDFIVMTDAELAQAE